jgi:hypothetical protein
LALKDSSCSHKSPAVPKASRNSSPYRLDPPLGVSPQSRGYVPQTPGSLVEIPSSKPKRVMYRISNGAFAGCAAVIVAKPLPNLADKLWFSGRSSDAICF